MFDAHELPSSSPTRHRDQPVELVPQAPWIVQTVGKELPIPPLIHPWRRPGCFAWLMVWSLVCIPVFAVLHNVSYALGELSRDTRILPMLFEFLHLAEFIVSLVLCPAGKVIGVVG